MSIGILGGTFNPIHIGHLIMAEYVRDYFDFKKIVFIPAGDPPLKNQIQVPKEDRYQMVSIAIKDNCNFMISDIEMKNKGKSYTVDTLRKIKSQYPEEKFYFIIGQDAAINFEMWYEYEEIITKTDIVIVIRGKDLKSEIENKYSSLNPKFHFVETPFLEISSTNIRYRIMTSKSYRYMVKDEVYDYIEKKGLYR